LRLSGAEADTGFAGPFMSRHLFLLVSVALLVATTVLCGGARPGEFLKLFQTEFHADLNSLRDDVRIVREQSVRMRAELTSLWLDARSEAVMLRADARFEAHRLAKPFVGNEPH